MPVEIPTPEVEFGGFDSTDRPLYKDVLLEYVGTLIFVYISLAGVNQSILTQQSQLHVSICFALGLTSGIVLARESGAHLNPAVTLTTYATSRKFSSSRMIWYIIAQLLGGFTAAFIVFSVYYSWIEKLDEYNFIGAFGTQRNPNNSLFASVIDQFIGSALLMFSILVTPASEFKPLIIGVTLGALGLFQGTNGFAFNLARDFAPRLASAFVFGSKVFTSYDNWFWVPMVVPFFGVPFGYAMYRLFVLIQ